MHSHTRTHESELSDCIAAHLVWESRPAATDVLVLPAVLSLTVRLSPKGGKQRDEYAQVFAFAHLIRSPVFAWQTWR